MTQAGSHDATTREEKNTMDFSSQAQGYVLLATIAEETDAQGSTLVQLRQASNPFELSPAYSTQRFTAHDIGKKVVCIPMAGADQLLIAGLLPADDQDSGSVLDEIITTASSAEPSSRPTETPATHSAAADREVFPEGQAISAADARAETASNVKIIADGQETEHLLLRAETAITLQCGEASISLTCDGRVRINGRYVHSRASHTQRITGGAVKIN